MRKNFKTSSLDTIPISWVRSSQLFQLLNLPLLLLPSCLIQPFAHVNFFSCLVCHLGSSVLCIEFIIQAYGSVLSPLPGGDNEQGNLSRALGSVVGTACLRAEGGVGPQLISHVFGLLKARDIGGLSEEDYWLASDEGTEWVIRTVDAILDVAQEPTKPHAKL